MYVFNVQLIVLTYAYRQWKFTHDLDSLVLLTYVLFDVVRCITTDLSTFIANTRLISRLVHINSTYKSGHVLVISSLLCNCIRTVYFIILNHLKYSRGKAVSISDTSSPF